MSKEKDGISLAEPRDSTETLPEKVQPSCQRSIAQNMSETDLLPDALRDALGQILAEERRQWRRERELIQSEAARINAELRAQIAEQHARSVEWHSEFAGMLNTRLAQCAELIDARLAEVKDGKHGERGEKGDPGLHGERAGAHRAAD